MAKEVKNGRSKIYTCDGAALAKIFEKKGINPCQFGEELGYHRTYFPKCIRSNKIGEKAIGMLMTNGIMPSQYDVEYVLETKKKDPEAVGSLKDISKNKCERCNSEYDQEGCKIGATADTNEEKSPVEKAVEEPGVVKLEFTIDIVKLKAIVKAAVKEAYEEL